MDTVDIANQNDDCKYVLVVFDIFIPFAQCQHVKSKKGVDVLKALYYLQNRKRKFVISDRGIEFRSEEVNKYLQGQNIRHFYALNTEAEANDSERFIKTLKHKLFIYVIFTETTNR